jgi:hypothetical protein
MPDNVDKTAKALEAGPQSLLACLGAELNIAPYSQVNMESPLGNAYPIVTTSRKAITGVDEAGRPYIIGGTTVFPPIPPTSGYLRNLRMRPEYLICLSSPLSSDAFSDDPVDWFPKKAEAQMDSIKATRRLMHKAVTDFIETLEAGTDVLSSAQLSDALHRRGINFSLLGNIADVLGTKVKCLHAASTGEYVIGKRIDVLTKTLQAVQEEMAVRAFRTMWMERQRQLCSSWAASPQFGVDLHTLVKEATTTLVRSFLGSEADPKTSTLWGNTLVPYIRDHFKYRSAIGRSCLNSRSAIKRLRSLCGIVLSDGSDSDAINKRMLHERVDLLGIELRRTRACVIGVTTDLLPMVKAPCPPALPPLWRYNDVDAEVLEFLERKENELVTNEGTNSSQGFALAMRRAECLRILGEGHFKSCERHLLKTLFRQQVQPLPQIREGIALCTALGGLYIAERRFPDAIRVAQEALAIATVSSVAPPHHLIVPKLFGIVMAASQRSAEGSVAIQETERAIVASVGRIERIRRDNFHALAAEIFSCPIHAFSTIFSAPPSLIQRQMRIEQRLLQVQIDFLCANLKMVDLDALLELSFHPTVISLHFMKFLNELARREALVDHGRAVAIYERLYALSLAVQRKFETAAVSSNAVVSSEPLLVRKCRKNLDLLKSVTIEEVSLDAKSN